MNLAWGFVDVREVADAHVRAIETPAASGRYITAAETVSMRSPVEMLDKKGWGNGNKLPRLGMYFTVGDFAVRLSRTFSRRASARICGPTSDGCRDTTRARYETSSE